jgi:metal-responsive CopG/Arc/MetJ family transcriptional regulator
MSRLIIKELNQMALESPKARGRLAFLGTSINVNLIREVDQFRGEIPRSRIIERALRQFLERERERENVAAVVVVVKEASGERTNNKR